MSTAWAGNAMMNLAVAVICPVCCVIAWHNKTCPFRKKKEPQKHCFLYFCTGLTNVIERYGTSKWPFCSSDLAIIKTVKTMNLLDHDWILNCINLSFVSCKDATTLYERYPFPRLSVLNSTVYISISHGAPTIGARSRQSLWFVLVLSEDLAFVTSVHFDAWTVTTH